LYELEAEELVVGDPRAVDLFELVGEGTGFGLILAAKCSDDVLESEVEEGGFRSERRR
jgi:hypothetical protein